jgi:hypothetical protein
MSSTNRFQKAKREMTYMKNLVISPSGGGKSFTSLRLASGFAKRLKELDGKEHKIAFLNTEMNRGTLYAGDFDYDILDLKAPYEPEAYMDAMDDAMEAGYDILIIDSLTHEWSGKGGCLEIHSNIKGKDSYMNWKTVSPRHEAFMDKILDSKLHIFATVRGKDAYERGQNEKGFVTYEKVAMGYDQRKNLEYLFFTSFMIDLKTHKAEAVKDNTNLFTLVERLSEKHGKTLCDWAYNTTAEQVKQLKEEKQKVKDQIKASEAEEFADGGIYKKDEETEIKASLSDVINDIISSVKELTLFDKRDDAIEIISELGNSKDPRKITDIAIAEKIQTRLEQIRKECE